MPPPPLLPRTQADKMKSDAHDDNDNMFSPNILTILCPQPFFFSLYPKQVSPELSVFHKGEKICGVVTAFEMKSEHFTFHQNKIHACKMGSS